MPVYSLIALVLSIFGATYTAIAALRGHFDSEVSTIRDVVDKQLGVISKAGQPSVDTAEKYGSAIKQWHSAWKWSHILPIVFFWLVAFSIGCCSLVWWDKVTQPVISASAPATTPTPTYIEGVCNKGWWILFAVIVVNGFFSLCAIISCWIIKFNGKHLRIIHDTAAGVLANNDLQPAAPAAAPAAAPLGPPN